MRHLTISRAVRGLVATVVAVVAAVGLVPASATSLGGLRVPALYAFSESVSIPIPEPVLLAQDPFSLRFLQFLDGTADELGNVWSVHGGLFIGLDGDVVFSPFRIGDAHATVDVARSDDLALRVDLVDVPPQPGRARSGIAFFSNGTSYLYARYERDRGVVTIGQVGGPGAGEIASAPVADRESLMLSVTVNQPIVTVSVDGTPVLTDDLSSRLAAFGDNTRHGIASDGDRWTRFDFFSAETRP